MPGGLLVADVCRAAGRRWGSRQGGVGPVDGMPSGLVVGWHPAGPTGRFQMWNIICFPSQVASFQLWHPACLVRQVGESQVGLDSGA